MPIMLGNLTVRDIERRLGIELTDDERAALEETRQEPINRTPLGPGKWHCFDIPFLIECDTADTVHKIAEILQRHELKGSVQIGYEREE